MKQLPHLLLSLSILSFATCDKEQPTVLDENDFLIFGHFYSECDGEYCVETFKLTYDQLFEDLNDNYPGTDFDFVVLPDEKFEQVKDLPHRLPHELLTTEEDYFGCPDCGDQGGLLIQYSQNGNLKSWKIDQAKRDIPSYLHGFVDNVNEKIRLIQ